MPGKRAGRRSRASGRAPKRKASAPRGRKRPVAGGLLSIRGYADHRRRLGLPGATPWAVQKALASGRIPGAAKNARGHWQIDPEKADQEWTDNTDPTRAPAEARTFADYKLMKEEFAARKARVEYEVLVASLVEVEKVKRDTFAVFRMLRDRLLRIPDRIEAEIVALDPREAGNLLRSEIRQALEEVGGEAAK